MAILSKQHGLGLLREHALKHQRLVSTKPQLVYTLSLQRPLRVQKGLQRKLLRRVERSAVHRHIRMQQPAKTHHNSYSHVRSFGPSHPPGELLLEIRIARSALLPFWPARRRSRQLPHDDGEYPVRRVQGAQRRGRSVRRARVRLQCGVRVGVHVPVRSGSRVPGPCHRPSRCLGTAGAY